MRVLMLCSSYPRYPEDSASIFLRHLACALQNAGIDTEILTPDHIKVSSSEIDPGITITHFRYLPRRWQTLAYGSGILPNLRHHPLRWLQVPFFLLSMFFTLLRLCLQKRPDIIHAHWILPQGLIAVCIGKLLNIPVVTTAHGGDAFSLQGNFLARLKRITLRLSQAWTANTNTTAATVTDIGEIPRPHIVPMGVDIRKFGAPDTRPLTNTKKPDTKYLILFVGRLVAKKGVNDLIQAFSLLPMDLQKETELWIIGDGAERPKLKNLAQMLNIHSHVKFLGRMAHDTLPNYYSAADIFVAPSIVDEAGDTEGQGVVIIEAMASGLPVIASRIGGIQDVIRHEETGLLAPPQSPQDLSHAINTVLRDFNLRHRLSKEARIHTHKHYALDVIANQFIEIYSELKIKQGTS